MQCSAVQCSTVQYSTVQNSTVQYSTVRRILVHTLRYGAVATGHYFPADDGDRETTQIKADDKPLE
jgi:hypothetical protein